MKEITENIKQAISTGLTRARLNSILMEIEDAEFHLGVAAKELREILARQRKPHKGFGSRADGNPF